MQSKALLTMIALAAVALSGCASDAPSGEINGGSLAAAASGSYDLDANAANNPYPYADVPQLAEALGCTPDAVVGPADQPQLETCSEAFSIVSVSGVELPESSGYMLVLNGTGGEKHLGSLVEDNGTFSLNETFVGEDFTDMYSEAQIRFGDLVVAVAPGNGGGFDIAPSLGGASISASYSGKTLTYTVSGLPSGSSYTGWLVGVEEESTELVHMDDWSVSNGAGTYEADMNIGDYKELHIHASGSKINVMKVTIA
jgi:hypothetical protein